MLTLNLGPFTLALHHLLLLLALGIASLVGWRMARRGGENPESTLFYLFLLGFAAARAGFVLRYWPQYQDDPLQMIDIRDGGFLASAGICAVIIGALWQGWRRPLLRRPLGWGVASGLLFWALASFSSQLYERGTRLPDISLLNAAGQEVPLSQYSGRPLVINLWATWCPPCRREMPVLQQARKERPDVTFLFVNQGESPQSVSTFITTAGLDLGHVLFDGSGQLGRLVGSSALPTTLFYTADGRLLGSHLGELSRASLARALEAFEPTQDDAVTAVRSNP